VCGCGALWAATLPSIPADELFQKVAEDYVHFTAFQEMTGEQPLLGGPHGRFGERTLGGLTDPFLPLLSL